MPNSHTIGFSRRLKIGYSWCLERMVNSHAEDLCLHRKIYCGNVNVGLGKDSMDDKASIQKDILQMSMQSNCITN